MELSMENQIQTQSHCTRAIERERKRASKVFVCLFVCSIVHFISLGIVLRVFNVIILDFSSTKSFRLAFSKPFEQWTLCFGSVPKQLYHVYYEFKVQRWKSGTMQYQLTASSHRNAQVALTLEAWPDESFPIAEEDVAKQTDVLNTFGNFIRIYL